MKCSVTSLLCAMIMVTLSTSTGCSSNQAVPEEENQDHQRMQRIYFADGSIEYTLTNESDSVMRKIETIQMFNINGNGAAELSETELHRLFIATDTDGNRHISADEARAFYSQISGAYEHNLGRPDAGNRRR